MHKQPCLKRITAIRTTSTLWCQSFSQLNIKKFHFSQKMQKKKTEKNGAEKSLIFLEQQLKRMSTPSVEA